MAIMVIRRVSPMSAAKVSGALGVLIGLVIGACISLIALVAGGAMAVASDDGGLGAAPGMLFGAGAIIVLPIFYGVFMFIVGAVQAAFYNFAAKWTGGLEVDAS